MIDLVNLTKSYDGKINVVDGLNMQIEEGKIVVLIGKSGSGKSTTLRMINRLIKITDGDILIEGESIKKQNPIKLRRRIGYVIQKIGLMPHMTVGKNIEIVPELEGWKPDERKKRAKELLELVDLPSNEYYNRYPAELSGGQQQRIGVARALAVNPDIILMDEPFSALDPITRDQLQQEFLKLQDEIHKTIVFVTHDMDEALKIADKIAVLHNGKIIQYDVPEEILKNPVDDYVREFVGNDRLWQLPEYLYAKDVMRTDVAFISTKRSPAQAFEIMKSKGTYVGYVVDSDSKPPRLFKGEVTMEQLKKATRHDQKMLQILKSNVPYVYEHTNMIEVLSIMQTQNYKRVPVLNRDNCVVGYINKSSLLNVISEVMPDAEYEETVVTPEEG
ncbi:MAG: betaine/proline/choline family ABC transporter ATP-binding protein [Bacillota bacterium]|nr:betaine/proline/choline family ABC transporter ATP-binding protein [Bacillota bacterium]